MASARASSSGGSPLTPATASASISLTTSTSRAPSTSGGTAGAGAMLSIVRAPRRLARISGGEGLLGPDLVLAQDGGARPAAWRPGTWAAPVSRLAPLATMIAFSPPSSTPITAIAVGARRDRSRSQSTPGLLQEAAHDRPIGVRADMADEGDLGPGLGGGRRLVRPLAARAP